MKRKSLISITLYFLSIILLLKEGSTIAVAQIYPVQITTQLIPPYSGYVIDYADPSSEKLRIVMQFNDFTVPQYNVRLKLEIKGNGFSIQTKQLFNPPPIQVQPGVPFMLSGTDLAPYLNSNHLDFNGINQSQYEQGKALPEGYYSICVTAFDYYLSNTQVSNESCAQAWFMLSDPPLLNLPFCNTSLIPQTPQNILFQWTPMNMGSPNSAFNTEYDFELWEIKPDSTANPDQVVLSAQPIYKLTTQQTLVNYGIAEPELTLYQKYVWRVRARDLNGYDLFKNKGYSQVCTFTYGSAAGVVNSAYALMLSAQGVTHRMGMCQWNLEKTFNKYLLQVRKTGTQNWFDYQTVLNAEKITNLEPSTTYEARVRGEGDDIPIGPWSNTATFTTLKDPSIACDDQTMPVDPLQAVPLPAVKAIPGLIIQSGQFEVTAKEISPSGGPGWYKGKGYAKVLGGYPLAVKWSHIFIDDNNRHQQGVIEALTKGINSWLHEWDIKEAQENAIYVNGTIDSVYVNGNHVCVVLQGNSTALCYPIPPDANVLVIRDEEGNEYLITTNPPPPKIEGPNSYLEPSTDSLDFNDSLKVTFSASATQKFGFDKKEYAAHTPNYELIVTKDKNLPAGQAGKYFVPYKSLGEGQTDEVMADVLIKGFDKNQLSFKNKAGNSVFHAAGSSATQFKVTVEDKDVAIYAWYNGKKIGKLNLQTYKPLSKKLVLVPVNNASLPSGGPGWAALNDIYKQANISWSVSTAPNFTFDLGTDAVLESPDATLMSKYSAEMRALRDAYRQKDTAYDKNAYYVFVVPGFSSNAMDGYMVRGRAVGFISATPSPSGRTGVGLMAHELAHGAFGLEHTFEQIPKGTSNNLMDYSSGTKLTKIHWDQIHSSKIVFNWLDSEEDGSSEFTAADNMVIFSTLNLIKKCIIGNLKMGVNNLPATRSSKLYVNNTSLGGIKYDFIRLYRDNNIITPTSSTSPKTEISPKGKIHSYQKQDYSPIGLALPYALIEVDGTVFIEVPTARKDDMIQFLESPYGKNILLFVNGYRPNFTFTGEEMPNTSNNIFMGDVYNYWSGIDAKFIEQIGTKNAIYADGHMSISESNHKTIPKFLGSLASINNQLAITLAIRIPVPINLESLMFLNTTPNAPGFTTRATNGYQAGEKMYGMMLKNSIPCTKDANGNILDTVDVVAHSFGFAYAQGMIAALRSHKVKVKRYYFMAPENACSGVVDQNSFEEIWQYGSNENPQSGDKIWEQDGVAPQCPPTGLSPGKRAYIPNDAKKEFLGSHFIDNYFWIFDITDKTEQGYVSKRQ